MYELNAININFENFAAGLDRPAALRLLKLENKTLPIKPARIHLPYLRRLSAPRKDFSETIPTHAKTWHDLAVDSLILLEKMDAAMLAPCGVEFVQADDGEIEAWLIYEIK